MREPTARATASVYRGRFAPSPTGPLHFGSLVAALASWLTARLHGGSWLLRIEDIDPPREVPGAAREQIETLKAFGMESDEPILWQSTRIQAYRDAFERLRDGGRLFPCACSRSLLGGRPHQGVCAKPADGAPVAWRLAVGDAAIEFEDRLQGPQRVDLAASGDFVVRRSDGLHAYQLAVVVDDAFQGVTEVVRGVDLLESTPRQILLQRTLGLSTPGYAHLPVVCGPDGRKLSKSLASLALDRREPLPVLRQALGLLGIGAPLPHRGSAEKLLGDALAAFDAATLPRGSALHLP